MLKRPRLAEHVMKNVYFDTCVYHQPGIDLLFRVIDVDNILFGSEMVGAVRGIDPETGQFWTYNGLVGAYTYSDMTGYALSNVGTPSG